VDLGAHAESSRRESAQQMTRRAPIGATLDDGRIIEELEQVEMPRFKIITFA
jgi:hypothetical protein